MEISLKDLWKALRKAWVWMLLCALLFGGAAYVYNSVFVKKQYSSSITFGLRLKTAPTEVGAYSQSVAVANAILPQLMTILVKDKTAEDLLQYCADKVEWAEAKAAEADAAGDAEAAAEYRAIVKDYTLSKKYTGLSLAGSTSIDYDSVTKTNYNMCIKVTYRTGSPQDCAVLCHAMSEHINSVLETFSPLYVFEPYTEIYTGTKVAPNARNQAMLFGFVGLLIPYVVAFIAVLVDRRIYTEDALRSICPNYAILGQIPTIEIQQEEKQHAEA